MTKYSTACGIELSQKQCECIRELKKLARKWKKDGEGLWLFSGSGTLHVMMRGDTEQNPEPENSSTGGVNPDNCVTIIHGIPNDGGDW
jgi:hypothetical protein